MDYQDNNQYEMWQPEKPKSRIGLGILIGALSTIFVLGLVIGIICITTNTQITVGTRGAGDVMVQGTSDILDEEAISKINELSAYAKIYYYNDMDAEAIQDSMYEGLIEGLGDKYSVYYNEEDYAELQLSTTGQYYGIGAGLTQDLDTMVVSITKVYKGTPSEAAGLKNDDIIISVDGIDGTSMEVSELVKHIRGEEGTTVHLEIYRPATDEYLSFDVERADITLPSVDYEMMENGIGYILIDSFETETAHQFEAAVEDLTAQGMQAMILDVRYNPGGMVNSVVDILDAILPEGLLVYIEDKAGNRQDYTSDAENYMDLPIAVLINEDSASASEILAGAIKDYEYGTLIGTTTFGKGIVQTIFPLPDGDALKLTTAKYFTPSGNYIHEVGVEPDIELEYEYLDPEGEEYERQYDNQILKAIEVLSEQMEAE
ncbi:MAG: S41 family peptidase [Roseburia sp.]|nr:S41 family peptidase [Roseburia sp.]